MRLMRYLFASFLLLAAVSGAAAIEYKPYPSPRITVEQWQRYYDEVKAALDKSAQLFPDLHLVVYQDRESSVSYAFTQPGHAAHPAWIARKIVEQDGRLFLDQVGYFAGEEAPFAALFEQYQQLNKRMMEELERQKRPK